MKTRSAVGKIGKGDCSGGNTNSSLPKKKKQVNRTNRWCFTYNNGIGKIGEIFTYLTEGDKCIIGEEVGESGTPHLQGYIHFKLAVRPMSVIPIKEIHWEKCKGNERSNILYCSKDNKFKIFNNSLIIPRKRKELVVLKANRS